MRASLVLPACMHSSTAASRFPVNRASQINPSLSPPVRILYGKCSCPPLCFDEFSSSCLLIAEAAMASNTALLSVIRLKPAIWSLSPSTGLDPDCSLSFPESTTYFLNLLAISPVS
uniref:Putative secreted protein n=1 Tax=Anopheles marajoara TaxID=58244 RepID=A0A2M4C7V6_9DIPT